MNNSEKSARRELRRPSRLLLPAALTNVEQDDGEQGNAENN
jgi:hypothetical protein